MVAEDSKDRDTVKKGVWGGTPGGRGRGSSENVIGKEKERGGSGRDNEWHRHRNEVMKGRGGRGGVGGGWRRNARRTGKGQKGEQSQTEWFLGEGGREYFPSHKQQDSSFRCLQSC